MKTFKIGDNEYAFFEKGDRLDLFHQYAFDNQDPDVENTNDRLILTYLTEAQGELDKGYINNAGHRVGDVLVFTHYNQKYGYLYMATYVQNAQKDHVVNTGLLCVTDDGINKEMLATLAQCSIQSIFTHLKETGVAHVCFIEKRDGDTIVRGEMTVVEVTDQYLYFAYPHKDQGNVRIYSLAE